MPNQFASARVWGASDIRDLLDTYLPEPRSALKADRTKFKGLITQDKLKLKTEHFHLIFEDTSLLMLSEEEFGWLLGSEWQETRNAYLEKVAGGIKVLDRTIRLDLSDVTREYSLSKFNVLAREVGVKVQSLFDASSREIPQVVNLAIALSLNACRAGRGRFLWQAKARSNIVRKEHWHQIPDIVYTDDLWLLSVKNWFLEASYGEQRDFLNADRHLQSNDVCLPFLLDFPGTRLANDEDARIIAYIDAVNPPLAAISVPGAAYIGWIKDMIPMEHSHDFTDFYLHHTEKFDGQYLLSEEQRRNTIVPDTLRMYQAAVKMFDNPIPKALIRYQQVMDWKANAEELTAIESIEDIPGSEDEL